MEREVIDLPPTLPTPAVLATLDHVLAHGHEVALGVPMHARDHFIAVLLEEIGLQERKTTT